MPDTEFTIRRKVLTLLGAKFHIYKPDGSLLGFSKQKAFKLKEDIRIYTDESMSEERVLIQARSIVDFSGAYDVIDSRIQTNVGSLRRRGMASLIRDTWTILDEHDQDIAALQEDSTAMALVRRFLPLGNFIPQKFSMVGHDGGAIAQFRSHFNPFVQRMTVTVLEGCSIDPLLVLATGVLLMAIEGRQNQ
jgi:hypothetical protein